MSIKDLFEKKNTKFLASATQDKIGQDVESSEYLDDYRDQKSRFIPPVDFSKPENFARFGSAEKYYEDSIKRIYNTYPYDGSLKERIQWENSSSYLDLYIFDNGYPRTNGHVIFSAEGWGTAADDADGYGSPATPEYILIKGGPNTSQRAMGKDIDDTSGDYTSGYANKYDLAKNRESNLKIGGVDGNTVEFWLKKEEFLTSLTKKEVIFDAYTTDFISSSINYGRLTIEMTGTEDGSSPFLITYMSGTSGFSSASIGQNITTSSVADDKWHHYAFVFANTGSNLEARLYIDGACNHTLLGSATTLAFGDSAANVNYVSGNIKATIGSLATRPSGTIADPNAQNDATLGWGKLSGSVDEFRFWKTARNSLQINRQMIEPIGGGTNTDDANTTLGVYYKFNEGITQTASSDSTILDYSGRISNGHYFGYNTSVRSTASAMVNSGKVTTEFKDPILYSFHPDVKSFYNTQTNEGKVYDYTNNSSIYYSLPAWIIEEDEVKDLSPLRNLTQMIGSYFDTLANNIKVLPQLQHKTYLSASYKPYPFADRLLESVGFNYVPELFSDATALEQFRNRNEERLFKQKLYDIKNTIYQNIYNNIVYIYKTKGTEKSFRNLIRCFGVDDEIYKINIYSNFGEYELNDNIRSVAETKKYANFTLTGSNAATVYQYQPTSDSNQSSFISGTTETDGTFEGAGLAFTMESEVVFPRRVSQAEIHTIRSGSSEILNNYSPFITASLFGLHQVSGTTENDLTWHGDDYPNFQVYAVKETEYSKRCFFRLTGTAGAVLPELTSSYFSDVFDDEKWNFSVSIKPSVYPVADNPDGSEGHNYIVEFYGAQNVLSDTQREFLATGTISNTDGRRFMSADKSVFVGAHRTNFSGSLLERSDASVSSTRVWLTHLSTGTIKQHATDVKNYGVPSPYRSAYLFQSSMSGTYVPEIETLALNWNFDTVSSSDASGQFIVKDFSSGSTSVADRYNWLGDVVGLRHPGRGDHFPTNFSASINTKYLYSGKKQLPETVYSKDMVKVLDSNDDQLYTRDTRPINYYIRFEKSMYQTISEEIINMFSSIKDFNNLIGEPVNLYRTNYKKIEKLRQLFFDRVNNTPDLDKYVEYYKWLDSALDVMLTYLAPASSGIGETNNIINNMVESHVLERNKYRHKYPTFEDNTPDPEAKILAINELLYDWKHGHAPTDESQADNCVWWKERAERDDILSSGDSGVDSDKDEILNVITTEVSASGPTLAQTSSTGITSYVGSAYALRAFSKPYKLNLDENRQYAGGVNFNRNRKVGFPREFFKTLKADPETFALVVDVDKRPTCDDDATLDDKAKHTFGVKEHGKTGQENKTWDTAAGTLVAPYNIVSSSVEDSFMPSSFLDTAGQNYNIVNLHHDVYGPDHERPAQGPFTNKFVGGNPQRHVFSQFSARKDAPDAEDVRPEAWRFDSEGGESIDAKPSFAPPNIKTNQTANWNSPRALYYRDETAKRPVNIRNIQMTTGAASDESPIAGRIDQAYAVTNIGNYTHDYDILHTNGRSINNRYLIEVGGLSGSAVNSAVIEGLVEYTLPERTLTGSNQSVFVNRFSAPGSPAVSSIGSLDFEAAEYSVYNAMTYRNLIVRTALDELYTDHCKQFGFFSDTQNSASYVRAGIAYPGTSGSVSADNYEGDPPTASYHKVNRNTRKSIRYSNDGTGDAGTTATASIRDNWFVQRPIPQTDLQYSWITASLVEDYDGAVLYGYEQPDWSNASLASSDITFASASNVGSFFASSRRWFATDKGAQYSDAQFIPVDFVGLNSLIYDPLTSNTNQLGTLTIENWEDNSTTWTYAGGLGASGSGFPYLLLDTTAPRDGEAKILNSIINHRQGPYGWPSWKQIRGGNHPVIRKHREENRFSWREAEIFQSEGRTYRRFNVDSQIEPPVTSKYRPLTHHMTVKTQVGSSSPTKDTFVVHSYGNQLTKFTEKISGFNDLNNNTSIVFHNPNKKMLMYDTLTYLLRSGDVSKEVNPIDSLMSIDFPQTVYPREKYTYLKKMRQRENYVCGFWRETRQERTDDGTLKVLGIPNDDIAVGDGQQDVTAKISLWPMDARNHFSTGSTPTGAADIGVLDSYGILQNDYMQFVCIGDVTEACAILPDGLRAIRLAPTYITRYIEGTQFANSHAEFIYAGDTKWAAGEQAGVDPFYKNYESYVEDLRRQGKDYGIIPEFRISDHMEYYINEKFGDFLASNTASLSLTGASETAGTADFFKVYSHTDFLKYFEVVKNDYAGLGFLNDDVRPRELTLRCKALMKFLPYDGFYPAQRTVDMTKLFWDSYKSNIVLNDELVDTTLQPYYARNIFQAMFSPGLLYNTIKSGLAVDYPVMTSSHMSATGFEVTGAMSGTIVGGHGIPRINDNFDARLPFETLVDPENYLGGLSIGGQDPNLSASINMVSSLAGAGSETYKLAMHNFLAESINLFLPNGKLTTLASKPDKDVNFGQVDSEDKVYIMRLVCSNATYRNANQLSNTDLVPTTKPSFRANPPTIQMYKRTGSQAPYLLDMLNTEASVYGSSFGYPVAVGGRSKLASSDGSGPSDNRDALPTSASYAPFTPPYYDGYSQIVFAFKPEFKGKHDLTDIFAKLTASVEDIDGLVAYAGGGSNTSQTSDSHIGRGYSRTTTGYPFGLSPSYDNGFAWANAMQLTASVNYLQATNLKYVDYSKSGKVQVVKDDPNRPAQWMIQPKFETPILDFKDVDLELPLSGSGSVARGMWHQYGAIPTGSQQGVFLQIQDLHPSEIEDPKLTGSLADLVGFDKSPKRIGNIAQSRQLSEAVIAVPFRQESSTQKRFYIDRQVIDLAEMYIDGQKDEYDLIVNNNPKLRPSPSIIDMVQKMRKYVLPPRMDFLRNKEYADARGGPFAMYIFEFKANLTQTDLSKMWQNLPPDIGETAQQQEVSIPHNIISASEEEEFGTEMIKFMPEDIQWMVFKAKVRAKYNYFAQTADSRDDTRFKFDFQSKGDTVDADLKYSYNWPYDYFSLVELVNLETKTKFSAKTNVVPAGTISALSTAIKTLGGLPEAEVEIPEEQTTPAPGESQ